MAAGDGGSINPCRYHQKSSFSAFLSLSFCCQNDIRLPRAGRGGKRAGEAKRLHRCCRENKNNYSKTDEKRGLARLGKASARQGKARQVPGKASATQSKANHRKRTQSNAKTQAARSEGRVIDRLHQQWRPHVPPRKDRSVKETTIERLVPSVCTAHTPAGVTRIRENVQENSEITK